MDFRQIYDEHVAFVWRSLGRLGLPDCALGDGVQDVFLVVHRRLSDFEQKAKVSTWLFRICMGVAKDYKRRAHVRREVLDDTGFDTHIDPGDDASRFVERREDLMLFEAALEKLDLDQRAVFILFELENMSGEQVAETLEIPLGTVYSRLKRAREIFKSAVRRLTAREGHNAHLWGLT